MKKILLLTLLVSSFAFGQKLKVKKDIAYIDGKEFVKVSEDKVSEENYIISALEGKSLFYLKMNSYNDPKYIDYKYNPTGKRSYFEVMSPDLDTIYFETEFSSCLMGCGLADDFVKMIYNAEVLNSDGTINNDKLVFLSKKIGFEFSKKREELKNTNSTTTTNTVIIKEEPSSGVNIKIGGGKIRL